MQQVKIGLVSPNRGFIQTAKQVAERLGHDLETAQAIPEELVLEARKLERRGVEVIISRRGTASFLRSVLNVPVLSVPLTSLDLLSDIQQAKRFGSRILVPTLRHRIEKITEIQDLLNVEIVCYSFKTQSELEQIIKWGKDSGFKVVIGGENCLRTAKRLGLHGVEIQTSKEAIAHAFKDAEAIAFSRREERNRSQLYRTIIDTMTCGIIAIDLEGYITTANLTAKKLLGMEDDLPKKCHINQLLPFETVLESMEIGTPMLHKVETFGQDRLVLNYLPVVVDKEVVGCVITCRSIATVMGSESAIRKNLTKRLIAKYSIEEFAHGSVKSQKIVRNIKEFAPNDSTVLITGPTGTGKEIVASSIHNLSLRRDGPFVSVNCCSLPEQLLESELFGYEEGSFTGSRRGGKTGLFEMAHKGTIFLDEIGGTPFSLQSSLLRLLQEREVMRIGGDCFISIDIRVIAATNLDLSKEVAEGRFREDLFYRLNVLQIAIPPLRERSKDIPPLINRLLGRISVDYGLPPFEMPAAYVERLRHLPWPGNVRQLSNFLERLSILSKGKFSPQIFQEMYDQIQHDTELREERLYARSDPKETALKFNAQVEEARLIRQVLKELDFDKGLAAEKLGISRTTLWRKMKAMQRIEQFVDCGKS